MGPKLSVSRTSNLQTLKKRLDALKKADVLVGIPQKNNSRADGKIGNAEALFLLEHGSPARNQPERPVVKPGIKRAEKPIGQEMKQVAALAMNGDRDGAIRHQQRAGTLAANAVKRFLSDYPGNSLAENAESTIRAKGFDHPGVETGALRQALTYVVIPVGKLPQDKPTEQARKNKSDKPFQRAKSEELEADSAGGEAAEAVEGVAGAVGEAAEVLGEVAIL